MGAIKTLAVELRIVRNAVARRLWGWIYRDFDIWWQKRRLRSYAGGVQSETEAAPLPGRHFAIFVFYEPDGTVSDSTARAIRAIRARQINIILVCNHDLSPGQHAFLMGHCHTILRRDNQGFDFGGYKDAVSWLAARDDTIERVMFLNDSVFFAEDGLDDFFDQMMGPEDVIGAFENWGEDYHIASFALSISGHVFQAAPFRAFWADYLPVNNRIHAIEKGEKNLSHAALQAARDSRLIYGASELFRVLSTADEIHPVNPLTLAQPWRDEYLRRAEKPATVPDSARAIVDMINKTSPIHGGAYYFPRHMGCPLFKKDIVYRERFAFWEVESWIDKVLNPKMAEEYLTVLRKKGDRSRLSAVERHKFLVGVK